MSLATPYPWQLEIEQQLLSRRAQLPHALLFHGIAGIGKKDFACYFAKILLCSGKKNISCGSCHACQLMDAGNHPDFLLLEPEENSTIIKIDQIRDLTDFVSRTSYQTCRIVIINPAHQMNLAASNALLKTLEEPPANTFFILISHQALQLPATIRSRCQIINFKKPLESIAAHWLQAQKIDFEKSRLLLKIAGGAPLLALEYFQQDIAKLYDEVHQAFSNNKQKLKWAETWAAYSPVLIVKLILLWMKDLIKFQIDQKYDLINVLHREQFGTMRAPHYSQLIKLYDLYHQTYATLIKNNNLNRQLVLENILLHWVI